MAQNTHQHIKHYFFSWWWVKNANKSIRRQYCYDEYGAQREKTWHRLYTWFFFLFQWPELLSLGTVDIWGQTIPSCSIPRLHPPDVISTSPSVRTKNVFRKCQMVPGGSTCTSNPRPEDQFPTSWKMWPSQPTVRLGKASRPETIRSVGQSLSISTWVRPSIFLSVSLSLPFLPHTLPLPPSVPQKVWARSPITYSLVPSSSLPNTVPAAACRLPSEVMVCLGMFPSFLASDM